MIYRFMERSIKNAVFNNYLVGKVNYRVSMKSSYLGSKMQVVLLCYRNVIIYTYNVRSPRIHNEIIARENLGRLHSGSNVE